MRRTTSQSPQNSTERNGMMTSATKISLSLHEVVTTRKAKMPWGVLLNEDDNDAAAKKISVLDKPPEFESNDIYGITNGTFAHQEGEWKTTIKLKATSVFMKRAIPPVISKKSFGKKELGWLSMPADMVPTPTDVG
jgi:hypothetical protein